MPVLALPKGSSGGVDDSVWSFHVWNEIYFSRGRHAADGWQALDATPQARYKGIR